MAIQKLTHFLVLIVYLCLDVEGDFVLQDVSEASIPDEGASVNDMLIVMKLIIEQMHLNIKRMELNMKQMETRFKETTEQLREDHRRLQQSCVLKEDISALVQNLNAGVTERSDGTDNQQRIEQPSIREEEPTGQHTDSSIMEHMFKLLARRCCYDWFLSGFSKSGMYYIDPDGTNFGDPPFQVYCDMITGFTFVRHEKEDEYEIPPCGGPSCYSEKITYAPSDTQIRALIHSSDSCQQFIKVSCFESPLQVGNTRLGWWTGRDGLRHHEWVGEPSTEHMCACGLSGSCVNPRTSCNCDAGLSDVWVSDSGYVTDAASLPIQEVTFGSIDNNTTLKMKYEIGPLRCFGSRSLSYPTSCLDLYVQGSVRSGWYVLGDPESLFMSFCDMKSLENTDTAPNYLPDNQPAVAVDVDVGELLLNNLRSKGFSLPNDERLRQILNSNRVLKDKLDVMNNDIQDVKETMVLSQRIMNQTATEQEWKMNNLAEFVDNNEYHFQELSSDIEALKTKINNVEADVTTPRTSVAFFARTVKTVWSEKAVIKFEIVDVNLGNGYNSETGKFTAPIAGIYYIASYARTHSKRTVWFVIRKNAYFYTISRIATGTGDLETNGSAVILDLKVGDVVDVYLGHGTVQGNPDIGGTSFLGHLIHET